MQKFTVIAKTTDANIEQNPNALHVMLTNQALTSNNSVVVFDGAKYWVVTNTANGWDNKVEFTGNVNRLRLLPGLTTTHLYNIVLPFAVREMPDATVGLSWGQYNHQYLKNPHSV